MDTATKPPIQQARDTASPSVETPANLKAAADKIGQVAKEDHAAEAKAAPELQDAADTKPPKVQQVHVRTPCR